MRDLGSLQTPALGWWAVDAGAQRGWSCCCRALCSQEQGARGDRGREAELVSTVLPERQGFTSLLPKR